MAKIGIHVGEDFPAEEVATPDHEESICRDREEWRRRHDEWHRRARDFRDDVHRAARRRFGDHSFLAHNMFVLRVLFAVAIAVVLIALLPRMLILGAALAAFAFAVVARHRFHHHFDAPNGEI